MRKLQLQPLSSAMKDLYHVQQIKVGEFINSAPFLSQFSYPNRVNNRSVSLQPCVQHPRMLRDLRARGKSVDTFCIFKNTAVYLVQGAVRRNLRFGALFKPYHSHAKICYSQKRNTLRSFGA